LDCSCPNLALGIFSGFFCDFRSIFRAFKQFLDFSGIVFALKINLKKNKQTLSNWAEPEGPTQVRAGQAVGSRGAHLGPAARQQVRMGAAAGLLGVRARDSSASAPT
jgi:hypothetical protein